MKRTSIGLAALMTVVCLCVGTEARADFVAAFAGAGTTEAGLVNTDGPGASASASYDSDPGLDFTIHSISSALINTDGAGHPSFHLSASADYSGPSLLIGSVARSEVQVEDTITFTLPEIVVTSSAGSQILGFVQIAVDGFLNSNGGNNLAELHLSGSIDPLDVDSTSNPGSFSRNLTAVLLFNGAGGVYTSPFALYAIAEARSTETGVTTADFGNTIKILGISYTDLDGNPLEGTTASGLGFDYQAGAPVPVPGALALLVSGLPGLAGYLLVSARRRRLAGQNAESIGA